MTSWIFKKTIPNYTEYTNKEVRKQYGMVSSVICIVCNILLGLCKILFGMLTNSMAIQVDGINNFSDVGSNVASLIGFKLASKHPDQDHPYGHGRMEYIAGLVISFLIILVGFSAFQESIQKLLNPQTVTFHWSALIALVFSILVKLWMSYFTKDVAGKIDSKSLLAMSKDSLNDVLTTFVALISLVASIFTKLPIDGILGTFVSVLVLKAGYEVFMDTMDPILGKAPDKELVIQLQEYIMSYPEVEGIHDLMVHDYGVGRRFMTLHAEVDASGDMMVIHDVIDCIERAILHEFDIVTTIHMDPVDSKNEFVQSVKQQIKQIVQEVNEQYSIHDFRMVIGVSHTNILFDLVVPLDDTIRHDQVKEIISNKIKEIDETYFSIIQVEHNYT